jgi:hypothetical protein
MSFLRLTTLLPPMALGRVVPGVETLHDTSGIRGPSILLLDPGMETLAYPCTLF